jgi:hypothetical protein
MRKFPQFFQKKDIIIIKTMLWGIEIAGIYFCIFLFWSDLCFEIKLNSVKNE